MAERKQQAIAQAETFEGGGVTAKKTMLYGWDGTNAVRVKVSSAGVVDTSATLNAAASQAVISTSHASLKAFSQLTGALGNVATVSSLAGGNPLYTQILDNTGAPIVSFGGGTEYNTNDAYADGNTGKLALTVRDDALTTLTEADGDYSALRVDSTGRLWVNVANTVAVTGTFYQATQPVSATDLDIRDLTATDVVTANLSAVDNAVLDTIETNTDFGAVVGGGTEATALRVTLASDSTGVLSIDDNGGAITVDNGGTFAVQAAGAVAHDAADSGNPLKIGGIAIIAERASTSSLDRIDFVGDVTGKQIVLPYANPENFVDGQNSATTAVDTILINAQGAGVRNYITSLTVYNSSATSTTVTIKDGATTKMVLPAPTLGGVTLTLPTPLRCATNSSLYFTPAGAVSTIYVSAQGYKGV